MITKYTHRVQLTSKSDVMVLSAKIEGRRIELDSFPAFMAFLKGSIERGESVTVTSAVNKTA